MKLAVLVLLVLVLVAGYWVGTARTPSPFQLAKPKPSTIRALGQVKRSTKRGYLGGWCQAPCTTYRVRGTVASIRRVNRAYGRYLVVFRDGDATIAGRVMRLGRVRVGERVSVSGVLFFPYQWRDGKYAPNGAELSPVLGFG